VSQRINVYCDESRHLEHDGKNPMVLGAVWCRTDFARVINERIREIKASNGVARSFEAKWSKVSPGNLKLYRDLIDYFFDNDHLHFRAVIADKTQLDHERFGQDHDTWYYKMYFTMLKHILDPTECYEVYLDIKDTQGAAKVRMLHDVLATSMYDFDREIVHRVQTVRSHEVETLQLTDLLIGAVGYANQPHQVSHAKAALVDRMRRRSGYQLTRTTLALEPKVNLLRWNPQVMSE
jgi:hypothetical protein